jgi:hypothetical protein
MAQTAVQVARGRLQGSQPAVTHSLWSALAPAAARARGRMFLDLHLIVCDACPLRLGLYKINRTAEHNTLNIRLQLNFLSYCFSKCYFLYFYFHVSTIISSLFSGFMYSSPPYYLPVSSCISPVNSVWKLLLHPLLRHSLLHFSAVLGHLWHNILPISFYPYISLHKLTSFSTLCSIIRKYCPWLFLKQFDHLPDVIISFFSVFADSILLHLSVSGPGNGQWILTMSSRKLAASV